jgi:eukaryotic-like serine/threonine-protein kinase
MTFPNGTMLGRYRVEGILGQGQTGIVYRGFDTVIERTVAIKCLRSTPLEERTEEETSRISELFKEARVIGQLTHTHVAAVYDMGSFDGVPYFVMEYIEGETLKARMATQERFSRDQILNFMAMLARALHYVHQRGILHGDVKPANIVITPQGTPKIMDFGVARRSLPDKPATWSLAGEDAVWGTPSYLAPEQLTANEIDARADVFSLGVIAYEWLAKRKPFSGKTVEEILEAVVAGKPTPLAEIGEVDEELSRIIHHAMARDPSHRFSSADAFADALEVYQKRQPQNVPELRRLSSRDSEETKRFLRLTRRNLYFADFNDDELFCVLQLSHEKRYLPDEIIFQEGSGGSTMYLVVQGVVSVRKSFGGQEMELKQIASGDGFGEMAVVSQMPHSATVVALQPTEVIAISGAVLRVTSPGLAMKLYRNIAALLSERIRDADQRVATVLRTDGATQKGSTSDVL